MARPKKADKEKKVEEVLEEEISEEQEDAIPEVIKAEELKLESRAALGSKAQAMKETLSKQPKVRIFVPLASGEKQGVTQSVILNGYPIYIRKGTYVDVPQQIADVLQIKMEHKMFVENHPMRLTPDKPIKLTGYGN
jgi:hypothetical protein